MADRPEVTVLSVPQEVSQDLNDGLPAVGFAADQFGGGASSSSGAQLPSRRDGETDEERPVKDVVEDGEAVSQAASDKAPAGLPADARDTFVPCGVEGCDHISKKEWGQWQDFRESRRDLRPFFSDSTNVVEEDSDGHLTTYVSTYVPSGKKDIQ